MNSDNSDIIDVLPSGGEDGDISSHCTSLAEHSYCASIMSTNTAAQDLFGNAQELCNDMDASIRFPISIGYGDVNLDGFNYSVPSVTVCDGGGGGESLELENMWGGLNNDTSTTVVEVAATNDQDVQAVRVLEETKVGVDGVGVSVDIPGHSNTAVSNKSKPRRTDFIRDAQKRKNHFDLYFRKLTSDFHRVKSRTGSVGTLAALFEGRSYDGDSNNATNSASTERLNVDTSLVQSVHNDSLVNDQMDDHRYAATMLTQNVSSSAIRDHQYDEKTIIASAPDSDTDCDDMLLDTDGKVKLQRKKAIRYRTDYIKVRWERTQTFAKLIRSLFSSKIILVQRTGAEVKLSLEFEGIVFNDGNFRNASNVIVTRRNQLKSRRFHVLPTKAIASVTPASSPQPISSAPASLTFILPDLTSYSFPVPCVKSTSDFPIVSFPASVATSDSLSSVSLSVDTSSNVSKAPHTKTHCNTGSVRIVGDHRKNPTLKLVDEADVDMNFPNDDVPTENPAIMEEARTITSGASSPAFRDAQCIRDQLLEFDNSSLQNSPEVTRSRGMKESATNTEPICSICFSSGENTSPRGDGEHSKKSFWIRCNDPFCYDMVHASCVGFVVTHSAHLKQLPAFYCKSHR